MRTKTTLLLPVLALGLSGLVAQDIPANYETSQKLPIGYTADAGVTTKHVFRGIKRSNEAFTGGFKVDLPEQLIYVGAYTVQPFSSADNSEFDVYLGITDKLNDWLTYDFGLTYYYYPNKLDSTIKDAFEPYFGLTAAIPQVRGLAVAGYLYFDTDRKAFTAEVSAGYSRHLIDKLSLRLSAFVGYVDGSDMTPYIKPVKTDVSYTYYGASAELPYQINDQFTVILGVQYSETSNLHGTFESDGQFWGFGRVVYNF
ncbi:hypothetical protein OPIT5_15270 [Opitutaceae bacterium TAV5]|nr:hypothetical protein OPIT5_15270 [Opitutaceae bacterium TAV5]